MPLAVITLLALVSAYLTWRYLEARRTSDAGTQRLGMSGRRLTSAQEICQQAATRLKLNVVFVEPTDEGTQASAGAPWPVRFDILDRMAIRACLETGRPSGIGSGQHGGSDWLFIPLQQRGQTVAVAGVASAHCRRRLDPNETGMQSLRQNFLRYLSERQLQREQVPSTKVAPRLKVTTNSHADAA